MDNAKQISPTLDAASSFPAFSVVFLHQPHQPTSFPVINELHLKPLVMLSYSIIQRMNNEDEQLRRQRKNELN
jgi:hypothetical protein